MRENLVEFDTNLSMEQVSSIFQLAVKKRPFKLKVVPFKFFKPTPADDPFAELSGALKPEFEVGAIFNFPGPDPALGSVIIGVVRRPEGGTRVVLTSKGNMRGRIITNSLQNHVLEEFRKADPAVDLDRYSKRS